MNEKATIYDYARMCKKTSNCDDCPLGRNENGENLDCEDFVVEEVDKANEIILNWCKEHPVETRQDRFLKMFPNAKTDIDGVIAITPCTIEKGNTITSHYPCSPCVDDCVECRKEYWSKEV